MRRHLSRRSFLATTSAALGSIPLIRCSSGTTPASEAVFQHGVASGDPLSDRVMLWTKVSALSTSGTIPVSWSVATDAKLTHVVARGELETHGGHDFTVKVDVAGLLPAGSGLMWSRPFRARSAP